MRLGLNFTPEHRSPEEWADILVKEGFSAAAFPVNYHASQNTIDAYVKAAADRDILIAEVGAWSSPFVTDEKQAAANRERMEEQFRLADYVKANCCVNVSGAAGKVWNLCYPENYSEALYEKNVRLIQDLCDRVKPVHTFYTLEPMQWMLPDSPKQYAQFLKDVDREHFAVHMDLTNFIKDPYTYTHQEELTQETFDLLGDKIKSCHLKDCILEDGLSVVIRETLFGTGTMNNALYLEKIDQLGPDVPVLLEHLADMDSFRKAAANFRRMYPQYCREKEK